MVYLIATGIVVWIAVAAAGSALVGLFLLLIWIYECATGTRPHQRQAAADRKMNEQLKAAALLADEQARRAVAADFDKLRQRRLNPRTVRI